MFVKSANLNIRKKFWPESARIGAESIKAAILK